MGEREKRERDTDIQVETDTDRQTYGQTDGDRQTEKRRGQKEELTPALGYKVKTLLQCMPQ